MSPASENARPPSTQRRTSARPARRRRAKAMITIVARGLNTKLSQGITSAQGAEAMANAAQITSAAV